MSRPSIVFADGPTGNLDSSTSEEILHRLRGSVDTYGQTTVMVTRDSRAAAIADRIPALADRILFLDDGLIVKSRRGADGRLVFMVMGELGG